MSIPKWNLIWINNRYPAFFQPSKFLPVLFSYYQISNHKNIIPTYTKCYWSSIDAKSRFPYTINEVLTTWKLSISWWCNNPKPTCQNEENNFFQVSLKRRSKQNLLTFEDKRRLQNKETLKFFKIFYWLILTYIPF